MSGQALEPFLDHLGQLRISVFKEWPYLYEGSLEYERAYLRRYAECDRSLVALIWDGDQVVGATTAMPMAEEEPEFQQAFLKTGSDIQRIAYFGESILLPAYRGRGLGKEFFLRREAHALKLGLATLGLVAAGFLWTHAYPRLSLHGMVEGYSILAIAFAVAIYAAAKHDGHGSQTRTPRWHRLLCLSPLQKVGKYSYGMYVIHKPLHDLFSQTVLTRLGIQTSGHIFNACLHYVGLSLVTFALAWLSYNLYEVHFMRLKRHFA